MLRIGCHLCSSKGVLHMGEVAVSIGANTFRFFTRNPRGSRAKQLDCRAVHHPLLADLPFCLETPNELDGYARKIRMLRGATAFCAAWRGSC